MHSLSLIGRKRKNQTLRLKVHETENKVYSFSPFKSILNTCLRIVLYSKPNHFTFQELLTFN